MNCINASFLHRSGTSKRSRGPGRSGNLLPREGQESVTLNRATMDRVRAFIEKDPCNIWTSPTEAVRGMVNFYLEVHAQRHAEERELSWEARHAKQDAPSATKRRGRA